MGINDAALAEGFAPGPLPPPQDASARHAPSRAGSPAEPVGQVAAVPGPTPAAAGAPRSTVAPRLARVPDVPAAPVEAMPLADATQLAGALHGALSSVLLGASGTVTVAVVAAVSGGHLLVEDVPGTGKTVLARTLAGALGADLSRIQGHTDLLPSDVTGVSIYSPDTRTWQFHPGPVFAHVVLLDELNRTPPRTQSALLESMAEEQVTVDGERWPLPKPHLVIATQNPEGQLGTFPLVESQLDRFALATPLGYPDPDTELRLTLGHGGHNALSRMRPVCTTADWSRLVAACATVHVAAPVAAYAVALVRATRGASSVRLGASPRASITLVRSAQAHALLWGREYVTPDDVQSMAVPGLAHRLLSDGGPDERAAAVHDVLRAVPVPRP